MVRAALFDPTNRDLFNEQHQRFDWSLLQNGNVFRYDNRFQLDSASNRLTDLGYLVHRIDAHQWVSLADMYDALAHTLSYRRSYGASLDAFDDVFGEVGTYAFGSDPDTTGTVLAIAGFDKVVGIDAFIAHGILDAFARQARLAALYGHPMLCLVESTATDLERVGGITIYRGSVWDAEPDPPAPFHPEDLVEYGLKVLVVDPSDYVTALRAVLTDLLAPIGRWQLVGPTAVTDPTAVDGAKRAAATFREPPHPKATLWEVTIGIRGEGDQTQLEDQLADAHRGTGQRFMGMFSTVHPAGSKYFALALNNYTELDDRTSQ